MWTVFSLGIFDSGVVTAHSKGKPFIKCLGYCLKDYQQVKIREVFKMKQKLVKKKKKRQWT